MHESPLRGITFWSNRDRYIQQTANRHRMEIRERERERESGISKEEKK
jgi:hypothetical protein